jgi:tRNA/rRNA methyltransferase
MLKIVCIEIEHAKNLGAICRVMANFGLKELILINPKCKKTDIDAMIRAKHSAAKILKSTVITNETILKTFQTIIATTAQLGTSYNILRSPLTPEELSIVIHKENLLEDKKVSAALVIGREGHGLYNEEIREADFVVSIPCHPDYNTMNISHAVAILLYEIYKKLGTQRIEKKFHKASAKDKEIILGLVDDILADMTFKNPSKSETQRIVWKRMIGKALLTKREAFALIGFLKKLR